MSVDRDLLMIIVAVAIGLVVLAAIAALMRVRRVSAHQRHELRQRFGPEYDTLSREHGERNAARELKRRVKRVEQLHIEPLTERDRARYADAWQDAQRHFVDDPTGAVKDADILVKDVMSARGYPIG
ncbi:MAG: hypothetical protein H5U40_02620, partial [Polyangiaceae bacterium]|nr:hypothetical protein [Polyangiaceae bacterium]